MLSYENIKSTIKSKAFIQIKLLFGMSALFYQLKEQKFWPEREEEVEIRIIYKFFCFKENDQMNKQWVLCFYTNKTAIEYILQQSFHYFLDI